MLKRGILDGVRILLMETMCMIRSMYAMYTARDKYFNTLVTPLDLDACFLLMDSRGRQILDAANSEDLVKNCLDFLDSIPASSIMTQATLISA